MKVFAGLFFVAALGFAQQGIITTFAGGYPSGIPGPALQAALISPNALAEDAQGNYIVLGYAQVYKLSPDGSITSIAGTGFRGFSGDGGPASAARLFTGGSQSGIVIDSLGNIIFADTGNNRVRRISPDGVITTIVGTGIAGFAGDGGLAISARLSLPKGLALDRQGNLFIADQVNQRVRRVTPGGVITTVAGNGTLATSGDGGPPLQASLASPLGLVFDSKGNLIILEYGTASVRKLTPEGTITTIASENSPRNPPGTSWSGGFALAIDKNDTLYISLQTYRVVKLDTSGVITPFAGTGGFTDSDSPGPAQQVAMGAAGGMVVDSKGNVVMGLTTGSHRVGRVDPSGRFSYIAGVNPSAGANGPPAFARIFSPKTLAFSPDGNLYVEQETLGVRKVTPTGVSRFIAFAGGGLQGIAFDKAGNLYRTNIGSHRIQKIDPNGVITTFAGKDAPSGGLGASTGDGGPATEALLGYPRGIAFGPDGSLYFTEWAQSLIRKISPNGIITTIAGGGAAIGSNSGLTERLNNPLGIVVDSQSNVYFADTNSHRILKLAPGGGLSTFAGNGQNTTSGDGGAAKQAALTFPAWLAIDEANSVYVTTSNRVRKITAGGIITTVAGNGAVGYGGDGGPGPNATLNEPQGLAVDFSGNLYVADGENHRIRKVAAVTPFTVAPRLLFTSTLDGPPHTQVLSIGTTDGTPRRFQARSNVPWLTLPTAAGFVSAVQPAELLVTANPSGRAKGSYSGVLAIVDPDSGASAGVQVTLTVSGSSPQMRLSQVGLTFSAVQNGPVPEAQGFQVLNTGTGPMAWTATSVTFAGAGWLSVTPASGTATPTVSSPLTISVNPAELAPGAYYGQINVIAPGVDNSPQSAIVLLRVLPLDGIPGPQLDPYGLLFTSVSANPAPQRVAVVNPSGRATNYTVVLSYANGEGWLTVPPNGALTSGQRRAFEIQPRTAGLAAGVYRATLTFDFTPENLTRRLEIAVVVSPAGAVAPRSANANCVARQLVAVLQRPGAGYQTAAGWPVPMEAVVVDDCGIPFTAGRVTATFSSNDPAISMLHSGGGTWQATWASRSTQAAADVTIRLTAESADQILSGNTQVSIRSDLNSDQPSITPGGVVNAASFRADSPVSVGGYVSVFGNRLAKDFQQAQSLPLPGTLSDTVLFLGGKIVPLHFASDGQVNAILPYSIADNTTHQLIVRRGNIPSLPEPVLVATSQPAIFSFDGTGTGQGHIYVATAEGTFLADAAHPVKSGQVILFYATGLGPVTPSVVEGQPAPSSPLALPVNPIAVTIQGKPARVVFAGLAPGFAGVYQVNVIAPDDLAADPSALLVVSSGGQPSPISTMAVSN